MSTHDDARLAEIRERLNGYGNGYWERTYGHETVVFAMDIRELLENGTHLLAELDALRAAHTWTVATPAAMPPVGSGPWLVETWSEKDRSDLLCRQAWSAYSPGDCGWWSPTSDGQTKFKWPHSRFAAMPDEPAKEATPDA